MNYPLMNEMPIQILSTILFDAIAKGETVGNLTCVSVSKDGKTKTLEWKGKKQRAHKFDWYHWYGNGGKKGDPLHQIMRDIEGILSLDFNCFSNPFYELSPYYKKIALYYPKYLKYIID